MSETDVLDDRVRSEVDRGFVEKTRPPSPDEIARAIGRPQIEIEAALHRLAERHMLVLAPGTPYVWMAHPFSAIPTSFRVESGGKRWWGNCIWDALGILASMHRDGRVSTSCPDCGEPLEAVVEDGAITDATSIVHFALPAARWWDDIGST